MSNKVLSAGYVFASENQHVLMSVVGYFFHYVQQVLGIYNQWDGVYYYAEVHLSKFNCLIHTLFMPFTMLGLYVLVPAILGLAPATSKKFKRLLMAFHFGLYCQLSVPIAILCCLFYFIPFVYSDKLYLELGTRLNRLLVGFAIAFSALFVQEFFGHWLGGDGASRVEGVVNAIFYAMFFAVAHWFV